MDRSTARQKYAQHKSNAHRRGIEFDLSFDEWWEIWAPHWAQRGSHSGGKVMCRTHDKGPYKAGNVRIDTVKGNAAERGLMQRCARPQMHAAQNWPGITNIGFRTHASKFPRPDRALEIAQEEYEWIPGE